jgi:hypothetical protein
MAAYSSSAFAITSYSEAAYDFGTVAPPDPVVAVENYSGNKFDRAAQIRNEKRRKRTAILSAIMQFVILEDDDG